MKRTIYFSLLVLLSLCFTACSPVPNELNRAESLLESSPDSALRILRQCSPKIYKTDQNKALYGLLMTEALDGVKLAINPDSLLDFSIRYYENHPDKNRLATCYLFKARAYKSGFQYEKAIEFYLKATDEIQNNRDALLSGRINLDLGGLYNVQNEYRLARSKYKLAYGYFKAINYQPQAFYALLNIGRTYHAAKEYKRAAAYYRCISVFAKDSLQRGALFQEIGLNYYDFGKADSAKSYLKRILDYPYITNNRAIRYFLLARVYFDAEKIDSAFAFASSAFRYDPDIRTQRECYRIMTNCKFAQGKVNQVTVYMHKYVQLGDSLRKIDTQTKAGYIETLHYTRAESRTNKNRLWIAIGFIVAGFFLFYALIKRSKRRSKKEMKRTRETFIQQKADIRKRPVHKKRVGLEEKTDKLKSELTQARKPRNQAEREMLVRETYEKLLHINDLEFFFHEMDTLFHDLVCKLKKRYPDLSDKQLIWCCLHLLKIPTHDMLVLLDYKSDNSLKRMKNRLADRMGVESAASLGAFLLNIVSED